jgi:hypothetical protein
MEFSLFIGYGLRFCHYGFPIPILVTFTRKNTMMKLLTCLLLFSGFCRAGVVTGNLSHNLIYSGGTESASFDLDNNGVMDFQVLLIDIGSNQYDLNIAGMNGTTFETVTASSYDLVGYNSGTLIGNNSYQNSGVINPPYFPLNQKKYFGMKFIINGNVHCAYVGVKYAGSGGYQLLDFGYDETPDVCLYAGSGTSIAATQSFENAAISCYPNPAQNLFFVKRPEHASDLIIRIKDASGKVLIRTVCDHELSTLDLSELCRGMYFLEISTESEVIHMEKLLKD